MIDTSAVRVRFAPSPTGYLHVGGLRTALYNHLFARKHGGVFVLRIEDTDRTRLVEGAVQNLIETLQWAGVDYDEGPAKGGPYAPYVQSERLELYREHAQLLLQEGKAYRCFCTPERLEEMRKRQEAMRLPPKYDRTCLRLPKQEVERNLSEGRPSVIRMVIPEATTVRFHDIIRGDVEFASDRLDDQVLIKSDGYPTYHLANVVDDHHMQISHVIRGEEWLSSTPKHVLLYQSFRWSLPAFAHLPLLLNPDRSKLSKRQGDVAVEDYRRRGYLPAALVNFVALLGWNPGDEREVFTPAELVDEFSLERVGKSGAVFNVEKLNWINQQHLRLMDDGTVAGELRDLLTGAGLQAPADDYLRDVVRLMKERVTTVPEFLTFGSYFFSDPTDYDEQARRKNWTPQSAEQLRALADDLAAVAEFSVPGVEAALRTTAERFGVGAGKVIHATRLALTGRSVGPGLFELIVLLGREATLRRLRSAAGALG